MAEQVHVLSLVEDDHVQLVARLRDEAVARANAEFSRAMSRFCVQLKVPDGTRFSYEPSIAGLVPARLLYDTPDIPQTPDAPNQSASEASA